MKTKTLVSILILITSVLFIFAGKQEPSEEICGTWVNTDYNKLFSLQAMIVFNPDGTVAWYDKDSDTKPTSEGTGTYTITEKWKDDEGNIWYKIHWVAGVADIDGYQLCKISDSERIFEYIVFGDHYPTKLDLKHVNYRILYRQ